MCLLPLCVSPTCPPWALAGYQIALFSSCWWLLASLPLDGWPALPRGVSTTALQLFPMYVGADKAPRFPSVRCKSHTSGPSYVTRLCWRPWGTAAQLVPCEVTVLRGHGWISWGERCEGRLVKHRAKLCSGPDCLPSLHALGTGYMHGLEPRCIIHHHECSGEEEVTAPFLT